jgi:RimJ/RimL family protein N-acetyltransferase
MPLAVPDLGDEVVRLRPPAPNDVDAVTDACQDPDIPRFTRVPSPYRREDAEAWIAHATDAWAAGSEAVFVVVDAREGTLLGSTGLMRLDEARNVAEIGYWVAKEARRRGVATRAVRLVARWAVHDLGVGRLELMTHVDNDASQRVARATGFTREGVLRSYATLGCGVSDVVMFSLLPSDLERQAPVTHV